MRMKTQNWRKAVKLPGLWPCLIPQPGWPSHSVQHFWASIPSSVAVCDASCCASCLLNSPLKRRDSRLHGSLDSLSTDCHLQRHCSNHEVDAALNAFALRPELLLPNFFEAVPAWCPRWKWQTRPASRVPEDLEEVSSWTKDHGLRSKDLRSPTASALLVASPFWFWQKRRGRRLLAYACLATW